MFHIKYRQLKPLIYSLLVIILLTLLVFGVKLTGFRIIYQGTISMPEGFYLLTTSHDLQRNNIVLFKAPSKTEQFLLKHRWIPHSGLIAKHILGMPGDLVCTKKNALYINGKNIAPIYHFYAPGKKVPQKHFCAKLRADEYFLMSTKIARSFDSRYFGPIKKESILGELKPLLITN